MLGFVLIAVQGIMTVILFIVSIYNAGVGLIWGKGARDHAIAVHANAMADKDAQTGEKLARPFLHPRFTGLEAGDGEYSSGPVSGTTDYNNAYPAQQTFAPNGYPSQQTYAPNGYPSQQGYASDGYTTQNGYTSDGNYPPPVSSLYIPTPTSPSQEAQAIHPPFASSPIRESGSISDRTVVADPMSNTSSSSIGGHKKGFKGLFSRNKV